jgi:hypothetical protein
MKLVKIFGLSALVALAVMAVMGASTASAARLCLNNSNPCSEPKELVQFLSAKGEGKFVSGFVSVECHVLAHLEVSAHGGTLWLPVKLFSLVFTNCSGCSSVSASVKNAEVMVTSAGNGVLKGSGEAKFSGCPFGVSCEYKGEGTESLLDGSSSNALALVVNQKLPKSGGGALCSSEGTWNATFHGVSAEDKMTFLEEK